MNDATVDWKIPLYKIYNDDEDIQLITKIIKRGSRWALGPEIEELEDAIKNYVGVDYCVAVNSGTSALHATLLAYDIGRNNDVVVPSFSFIATANSVVFVGGRPVFADIERDTFGLNPDSILEKIAPSTKAILPMDYAGMSCKINEIIEIAEQNQLILIEDAAEGLGSSCHGKKVGSQSHAAIFSFCGNKVLTTGEGGAVVTDSKEIAEKIRTIRSHGRMDKINYFENAETSEYTGVGYNWRMSSFTASLGISQLHKLDKLIRMRKEHADYLSSRLSKHNEIKTPTPPSSNFEHIYQMYSIVLSNQEIRNNLKDFLAQKRIFSKIYFEPIHLTSFYRENFETQDELPVTEEISSKILTLPLYPNMTNDEKNYLVDSVDEFFEKYDA